MINQEGNVITHNVKMDIGFEGTAVKEVTLDGKPIAVTSLLIKAGANGYTNAVIEFPVTGLVEFITCVQPQLNLNDGSKQVGIAMIRALREQELTISEFVTEYELAQLGKRFIENFLNAP